jgi:hypothetical protein
MKRTPTNFGPYENEYRASVSWQRRWLGVAAQLALVLIGVLLAGYFLFPMGTPSNDGIGPLTEPPAPAPAASEPARP